MIRIKRLNMKNPFPTRAEWQKAIDKGLNDTTRYGINNVLKLTVMTWDKKPEFEVLHESNSHRFIGTTNEIWVMLNEGTEAHEIRVKNAKRLAFNVGGTPKSTPNQLAPSRGSPGTTPVFAIVVHHPGTEPRRWDRAAAKKLQPELVENMRSAFAVMLRKTGRL